MALIAQAQNIRQFVMTHLTDVIDPVRHFRDDPDRSTTGDQAFAVIRTPFNGYKLSCASAYIDPPAGAPQECKQLGTVTFIHNSTGERIVGPKADKTWRDISDVIHKAELADAVADAKRGLAEAAPHEMADRRAKLVELAERAKKWGIEVKVPPAPAIVVTQGMAEEFAKDPDLHKPGGIMWIDNLAQMPRTPWDENPVDPSASAAITPYIGAPIVYVTNPGEQISGMSEIPGHVVKVHSPDRVTIFITPDTSEPSYRSNLPRRGSDAGNGHVHKHNCWDYNPYWLAERERIAALEKRIDAVFELLNDNSELAADNADLAEKIEVFLNRIAALESAAKEKPRRGRPPKHEAAAETDPRDAAAGIDQTVRPFEDPLGDPIEPPAGGEQAA